MKSVNLDLKDLGGLTSTSTDFVVLYPFKGANRFGGKHWSGPLKEEHVCGEAKRIDELWDNQDSYSHQHSPYICLLWQTCLLLETYIWMMFKKSLQQSATFPCMMSASFHLVPCTWEHEKKKYRLSTPVG